MSKDDLRQEIAESHRDDRDHRGRDRAQAPARVLTLAPAQAQPRSCRQERGERAARRHRTWEAEMRMRNENRLL